MRLPIRKLCARHGLTLDDLAALTGKPAAMYHALDSGQCMFTSTTIADVAKALNIAEHEVLGYAAPPDDELPEPTRALRELACTFDPTMVRRALGVLRAFADVCREESDRQRNWTQATELMKPGVSAQAAPSSSQLPEPSEPSPGSVSKEQP